MYNVNKNDYRKNPKSNIVYTPQIVTERIWDIIEQSGLDYQTILDPAIGTGNLINHLDCDVIGVDVEPQDLSIKQFICKPYQDTVIEDYDVPEGVDLVVANPPFSHFGGGKLFGEVFMRHTNDLFGRVPQVWISPDGVRNNQRYKSKRWRWLKDNVSIDSILTLPIDVFPNTLFKIEVLFCNFGATPMKAHYFLED